MKISRHTRVRSGIYP